MIHLELEKLYLEDKKDRKLDWTDKSILPRIQERDKKRLERAYELISSGEIDDSEIWNCHYLALLLQHGDSSDDYKRAHEYAKKAVAMGSNVTKWLYAATLDRYLLSIGKEQKFGTQFGLTGDEPKLMPYDESTTDKERKEFGVPPIGNAIESFKLKYLPNK
jgi:TPR repeat protein